MPICNWCRFDNMSVLYIISQWRVCKSLQHCSITLVTWRWSAAIDKNFNNVFIVDSRICTVHGNYRGRSSTQLMKCFHLWARQLPGSTPSCHEQTWRGSSKHYVMSWEYFLPHFLTEPSEEFRNEQPFLDRYQILKGKAVDSERMIFFALLFVPFFTSWSRGHDTLWKMY